MRAQYPIPPTNYNQVLAVLGTITLLGPLLHRIKVLLFPDIILTKVLKCQTGIIGHILTNIQVYQELKQSLNYNDHQAGEHTSSIFSLKFHLVNKGFICSSIAYLRLIFYWSFRSSISIPHRPQYAPRQLSSSSVSENNKENTDSEEALIPIAQSTDDRTLDNSETTMNHLKNFTLLQQQILQPPSISSTLVKPKPRTSITGDISVWCILWKWKCKSIFLT